VEDHLMNKLDNPECFIAKIADLESVNIVTKEENQRLRHNGGDYPAAGIKLLDWSVIEPEQQMKIWKKKIRSKVSNWALFEPGRGRWPPPAL